MIQALDAEITRDTDTLLDLMTIRWHCRWTDVATLRPMKGETHAALIARSKNRSSTVSPYMTVDSNARVRRVEGGIAEMESTLIGVTSQTGANPQAEGELLASDTDDPGVTWYGNNIQFQDARTGSSDGQVNTYVEVTWALKVVAKASELWTQNALGLFMKAKGGDIVSPILYMTPAGIAARTFPQIPGYSWYSYMNWRCVRSEGTVRGLFCCFREEWVLKAA